MRGFISLHEIFKYLDVLFILHSFRNSVSQVMITVVVFIQINFYWTRIQEKRKVCRILENFNIFYIFLCILHLHFIFIITTDPPVVSRTHRKIPRNAKKLEKVQWNIAKNLTIAARNVNKLHRKKIYFLLYWARILKSDYFY